MKLKLQEIIVFFKSKHREIIKSLNLSPIILIILLLISYELISFFKSNIGINIIKNINVMAEITILITLPVLLIISYFSSKSQCSIVKDYLKDISPLMIYVITIPILQLFFKSFTLKDIYTSKIYILIMIALSLILSYLTFSYIKNYFNVIFKKNGLGGLIIIIIIPILLALLSIASEIK